MNITKSMTKFTTSSSVMNQRLMPSEAETEASEGAGTMTSAGVSPRGGWSHLQAGPRTQLPVAR